VPVYAKNDVLISRGTGDALVYFKELNTIFKRIVQRTCPKNDQ